MATTKIWAIKDSLLRVVNYAKNPEKTIFSNLKQVLLYAGNEEKTIAGTTKNNGNNSNISSANIEQNTGKITSKMTSINADFDEENSSNTEKTMYVTGVNCNRDTAFE